MSKHRHVPYFLVIVIAVITVLTIAVIMWFKPNNGRIAGLPPSVMISTDTTESVVELSDRNDSTSATAQNSTRFTTGLEHLPRSLQGTDVDGEIIIDDNRQLIVTEGLRRLFDYFLSALGEEDEAVISARVERYIRHHTPEPAASQAVVLFDQYTAYLKAMPEIEKRYSMLQLQATKSGELDLNAVAQQKQEVATLRQQYFDKPTITAFFMSEDEYDDYSMAMVRIHQNPQMSEAQKYAAVQDYISRLPDNTIKTNIEQQANLNALITRTDMMKTQGASPEALYNMRRELVGAPAAARLAQMDQEDASFDKRFTQYQSQKQRLLSQNTDHTRAQKQIDELEQQLFSDTERKRLIGYAALQQAKAQ